MSEQLGQERTYEKVLIPKANDIQLCFQYNFHTRQNAPSLNIIIRTSGATCSYKIRKKSALRYLGRESGWCAEVMCVRANSRGGRGEEERDCVSTTTMWAKGMEDRTSHLKGIWVLFFAAAVLQLIVRDLCVCFFLWIAKKTILPSRNIKFALLTTRENSKILWIFPSSISLSLAAIMFFPGSICARLRRIYDFSRINIIHAYKYLWISKHKCTHWRWRSSLRERQGEVPESAWALSVWRRLKNIVYKKKWNIKWKWMYKANGAVL